MSRPLHAVWALVLSACFSGSFLAGQPCASDPDCGTELRCIDGVCGGPPAAPTTSSTAEPTTASPTGTASETAPVTTPGSSTTDPSTSTGAVAGTTGDDTTAAPSSADTGLAESSGGTTGETCGLGRCKDIDMLFIYDDSASMSKKVQTAIIAMLAFQIEVLPEIQKACSVHFGVVTTDQKYPYNPPECQQIGALATVNQNGDTCQFAEGLPYATLPDLSDFEALSCALDIGADGEDDERPIDALYAAVTSKALNNGCNAGFYRPGAFLYVVLVSDEDDDDNDAQGNSGSSMGGVNLWGPLFQATKPTGVEDMYVLAVLGDEDPNTTMCPWMPLDGADGSGAESSPNLRKFVTSFPDDRHEIGSMCMEAKVESYQPLAAKVKAELLAACDA